MSYSRLEDRSPPAIKVTGACQQKAWLSNSNFVLMGHTASQVPYYL